MAGLSSLAKDTAIYGLSSIVGRFLNYLLVPLYTATLSAAGGGYGVITNVYAYTALLLVILTYGMETTFFRFANKEGEDPQRVYSTALLSVGATSLAFAVLVVAFVGPISAAMGYADHPSYVWVMAVTVALDAFQCIPFAYLRYKKRPVKFAALKLANILMSIALNLVFFLALPAWYESTGGEGLVGRIYSPEVGVGYAFYVNLFCSAALMLLLVKELTGFRYVFDRALLRRMLTYAWPILVLGIAGILNQTADKILFPYVYRGADAHAQLGIYGAASKIAMIMAMITQAFRYAYEPFVFGKAKDRDNRETYAKAMKYFVIFTLLAVMAAEIMMGVYFNLSFWYKLIDKTIWGAWFSGAGCLVLILVNVLLVPRYGYMACAWGGFAGYGTAMLLSYFVGQKHYPINYPVKDIMLYVAVAAVLFLVMHYSNRLLPAWGAVGANTVLLALFAALIVKRDFPLGQILKKVGNKK